MVLKKLHIHTILNLIVICLTLPMTIVFVAFSYSENTKLVDSFSNDFAVRAKNEVIASADALFTPIVGSVRSSATLADINPAFFLTESSADYLYELVASNEAVTSAYIAYSDGALRQVTRVTPGNVFVEQKVPPEATFVHRWLPPMATAWERRDRIQFHAAWGRMIDHYNEPSDFDPRIQPFYTTAVRTGAATVSEPFVSLSSRELTVSVSAPIKAGKNLIGVFSCNISLKTLSSFVRDNPVSVNSKTIIIDDDGSVIAHPQLDQSAIGGTMTSGDRARRLSSLEDPILRAALGSRLISGSDHATFKAGAPEQEYTALFFRFPPDFQKGWEVITISPTDDFLGEARRNRDKIILLASIGVILQLFLINLVSRSFSRPIERLAAEVDGIRAFDFTPRPPIRTAVVEIAKLRQAVGLLGGAIEAFSSYMPRGLVQDLLDTGEPIRLGGQGRYLTIFFTDLEGFTTLSETTPAQQLLERVSQYLEVVSRAVNERSGTIDKFIGDAVMAFWGAPALRSDHAYQACVAAVQSQRRMADLNAQWAANGLAPLRVRIGIHCDAVLVGNIGSAERMSYTVLGDGVNIAARLEGINKEFGTLICVSQNIYREAGERLWLRPMERVVVKGRRAEIKIFELMGVRGAGEGLEASAEEQVLCRMTEIAFDAYAAGDLAEAISLYQSCSERFPQDELTRRMAARLSATLAIQAHDPDA